jgi:microcystin-dependent protein
MSDPYLGEIRAVGFNFAPRGWAMCNGQLLSIGQNTALFSIIGTSYGGDGRTTFALPDLQGRFPAGAGATAGLTPYQVGEADGTSAVTLAPGTTPPHTHIAQAAQAPGTVNKPGGAVWATPHFGRAADQAYSTSGPVAQMSMSALSITGGDQPHNNLPPYLVLTFVIATEGIFPPRS